MSKIKVGINGFGRIGRIVLRALLEKSNVEVVAINTLSNVEINAHLLKYDSVQGRFKGTIGVSDKKLIVNNHAINFYKEEQPANIPWKKHDVDVVLECTGIFLNQETAKLHIQAGAKKVIMSAPAKDDVTKTIVIGGNENIISPEDTIISNASCTTNCIVPLIKIVDELCGVEYGYMNTIHAYTADQRLQDMKHKDLRRSRAAALSVIPTSTGAAKAVGKIFPHLSGKLDGKSVRVPVPSGSLSDLSLIVKKPQSKEAINAAYKKSSRTSLKGLLEYTEEPIVSTDVVGSPYSCILDSELTFVKENLVKVFGWYDNEMGYSQRLADLTVLFAVK